MGIPQNGVLPEKGLPPRPSSLGRGCSVARSVSVLPRSLLESNRFTLSLHALQTLLSTMLEAPLPRRWFSFLPWKFIFPKRSALRTALLIAFLVGIIINSLVFIRFRSENRCGFVDGQKVCAFGDDDSALAENGLPEIHLNMDEQLLAHAEVQAALNVDSVADEKAESSTPNDKDNNDRPAIFDDLLDDTQSQNAPDAIDSPILEDDEEKDEDGEEKDDDGEEKDDDSEEKDDDGEEKDKEEEKEEERDDEEKVRAETTILNNYPVGTVISGFIKEASGKWVPEPRSVTTNVGGGNRGSWVPNDAARKIMGSGSLTTSRNAITYEKVTSFELSPINAAYACAPASLEPEDPASISRPYSFMYRRNNRTTSTTTGDNAREEANRSNFNNQLLFCGNRYGWPMITNWRRRVTDMCTDTCEANSPQPQDKTPDPKSVGWLVSEDQRHRPTRTKIECHMAYPDIAENLCRTQNIVLDAEKLPTTKSGGSIDIWPPPGTLKAQCKLRKEFGNRPAWGYGGAMWLYDSLQEQAGTPAAKNNITCDAWVDHDLFMISRYDISNVYHIHQDFMHVFLGYGLVDLDPATTEIIFLDSDEGGTRKSHAIWKQAFSGFRTVPGHSDPNADNVIRTIRDLVNEKFDEKGKFITDAHGNTRKMRNLCLRSATFSVHGGLTLLSRQKGKTSQCEDSPMLRSFADFMLTRLNLPTVFPTLTDPFNPAAPRDFRLSNLLKSTNFNAEQFVPANVPVSVRDKAPIIITYLTRRPVNGRSLERTISNEYDLIKHVNNSLQTLFTLNQIRRPYLFRVVDFGAIPTMREQIAIARESDVLLGPHGAALVYSIYLPPHGCLIELQHPTRRNNFQFKNILVLTGRDYYVHPVVDPLRNIPEIADSVALAVAKVVERRKD